MPYQFKNACGFKLFMVHSFKPMTDNSISLKHSWSIIIYTNNTKCYCDLLQKLLVVDWIGKKKHLWSLLVTLRNTYPYSVKIEHLFIVGTYCARSSFFLLDICNRSKILFPTEGDVELWYMMIMIILMIVQCNFNSNKCLVGFFFYFVFFILAFFKLCLLYFYTTGHVWIDISVS